MEQWQPFENDYIISWYRDLTIKQIASDLNRTEASVKSHIARMKAKGEIYTKGDFSW